MSQNKYGTKQDVGEERRESEVPACEKRFLDQIHCKSFNSIPKRIFKKGFICRKGSAARL